MYKVIIILCLFLFPFGNIFCYGQHFGEEEKLEYEKIVSLYPKEFTDFLPEFDCKTFWATALVYPGGGAVNKIHVGLQYGEEQIHLLAKHLKNKAIACYHFTDSCLMMTNYIYLNIDPELHHFKQCDNLLPIPNFETFIENPFPLDFFEQAKIYVLDAKKGVFWKEKFLKDRGAGLSEDWQHGYSKGVLISGTIVYYWLEIW